VLGHSKEHIRLQRLGVSVDTHRGFRDTNALP
jgi:hypothetical protein